MDTLEVIARPHFDRGDAAWLTDIRARRTGNRGPPHFTLIFPGSDLAPAAFVAEVKRRAGPIHRVRFHLRSALVVPEPMVERFHVFLVPDEGFAAILKLHDALHAGSIEKALRPEMPYLPHITVATTADYAEARKLAGSLNNAGVDIGGVIETLIVEQRVGEVIKAIAEVPLNRGGLFG